MVRVKTEWIGEFLRSGKISINLESDETWKIKYIFKERIIPKFLLWTNM